MGRGWHWEYSCSEPCSPATPSTSLAPHQAISQKHAPKFPISLPVLKPAAQTRLHFLWKIPHRFQNRHPLTAALFFRIWGCPQPPRGSLGNHVPCYTGSWWSPGRHTSQESGLFVCPAEKSITVQHSRDLPQICAWLRRSPQFTAPSVLPVSSGTLPSGCPLLLQLLPHYRLHASFLTRPGHMAET